MLDKKASTNRLLVAARQLVLILEQNLDDEDLPDYSSNEDKLHNSINEFITVTNIRCENCGKKMPQDQINTGYRFCCKRCDKESFL